MVGVDGGEVLRGEKEEEEAAAAAGEEPPRGEGNNVEEAPGVRGGGKEKGANPGRGRPESKSASVAFVQFAGFVAVCSFLLYLCW